jgi:hypothetical protein
MWVRLNRVTIYQTVPKSSRTHGESLKHHAEFGCDRDGFSENDTIVPTDLANSTGNAIFDDTLEIALNVPAAIAFPESGARRLQKFPHPLETCRPRHPHPERSPSEHAKLNDLLPFVELERLARGRMGFSFLDVFFNLNDTKHLT